MHSAPLCRPRYSHVNAGWPTSLFRDRRGLDISCDHLPCAPGTATSALVIRSDLSHMDGVDGESMLGSPMVIEFQNQGRSYDIKRHCIRFWGHDDAREVSFLVDEDALCRVDPHASLDEGGAAAEKLNKR